MLTMIKENNNALSKLDQEFMRLSDALCELLAEEGISFHSYLPGLPLFSKLPEENKKKALLSLQFQYDLCMEQISEGYVLKDSPSFTWRALRKLGYVPTSDLFEKIRDDHVIEVYSADAVQIFRNLNFFEYCSYTFEEIYSLEWWNLFERPAEMSQKIYDATVKIFTEERRDNFDPDVPNHLVKETQSADKLSMDFKMELMGPLFVNKKPSAVICLESVRLIHS